MQWALAEARARTTPPPREELPQGVLPTREELTLALAQARKENVDLQWALADADERIALLEMRVNEMRDEMRVNQMM